METAGGLVDFSSFLKNSHLERLAEADECEVVRQIQVWDVPWGHCSSQGALARRLVLLTRDDGPRACLV